MSECRKRRYVNREDAERSGEVLAVKQPGDRFHAYRCPTCPPSTWHVGQRGRKSGAHTIWVDAEGRLHSPLTN